MEVSCDSTAEKLYGMELLLPLHGAPIQILAISAVETVSRKFFHVHRRDYLHVHILGSWATISDPVMPCRGYRQIVDALTGRIPRVGRDGQDDKVEGRIEWKHEHRSAFRRTFFPTTSTFRIGLDNSTMGLISKVCV